MADKPQEFHGPLEPLATAIGFICMQWSWLELVTDVFVTHLVGLEIGDVRAHCITANADFRAKLKMVRALGALRKPSDEWFAELETLLNTIENDLASRRNRVVHDIWLPPQGDAAHPTRTFGRTRLTRDQARQSKRLTVSEVVSMDDAACIEIHNDIVGAINKMLALQKALPDWPMP